VANDALTVNEAAETTGWSPRMLRYIERIGLVVPPRSPGGYRLYGAAELQRLRTLRELLRDHDVGLGDVGFARRLRIDDDLAGAVDAWLEATPTRPPDTSQDDWLRHEQEKHMRLLRLPQPSPTN
jgi:MerR family transcriptional regulator, copper efflux regulator